jgi:DNA-binding NtrC family response regulator
VETILVVDDEADIRTVVRGMLTDVVMPLMKGMELAQRLHARSPWTKVLLISAYKVSDVTASGLPFIAKPFSPDALADRVRRVLAQPSPFAGPAAGSA